MAQDRGRNESAEWLGESYQGSVRLHISGNTEDILDACLQTLCVRQKLKKLDISKEEYIA
jgi:hypothetical protein